MSNKTNIIQEDVEQARRQIRRQASLLLSKIIAQMNECSISKWSSDSIMITRISEDRFLLRDYDTTLNKCVAAHWSFTLSHEEAAGVAYAIEGKNIQKLLKQCKQWRSTTVYDCKEVEIKIQKLLKQFK
jgi:hypothetical protein